MTEPYAPTLTSKGVPRKRRGGIDTRANLLKAAIKAFARKGYAGARIDEISRAARSNDGMIYYYFGSKEKLFVAALEEMYARQNAAEERLQLDFDKPRETLVAILHFHWDFYLQNPEFIRLLNSENLHKGVHIRKSRSVSELSSPALGILERVLRTGARAGEFRRGLVARDIYLSMAALTYFYLSNQYTLSAFLGDDVVSLDNAAHWKAWVTDMVLRSVLKPG